MGYPGMTEATVLFKDGWMDYNEHRREMKLFIGRKR